MQAVECEFEAEVLAAVLQSRWPEGTEAALRAHVKGCAICSDVAAVAGAIENARENMRAAAVVPDSGRVWWTASVRARKEAVRAATRPITLAQLVAGACGVGLLGACFGATSAWFQNGLRGVGVTLAGFDWTGELMAHGVLMLGMAAVLLLVPVAAWLATRRE